MRFGQRKMINTSKEIVESVGSIISDEIYHEVEPNKVWVERNKLKNKIYDLDQELQFGMSARALIKLLGVDEDSKKSSNEKILDNIEALSMGVVLDIGRHILDELRPMDLKKSYKEVYNRYEKVCFDVLEEDKKHMTKKEYEEEKESIEDELRNVENFLSWCQHEEKIKIRVNKK